MRSSGGIIILTLVKRKSRFYGSLSELSNVRFAECFSFLTSSTLGCDVGCGCDGVGCDLSCGDVGCVVNCDVSTRSTVGCDVLGWRLNGFSHRWFYSGEDYPWGKTTQVTGDKHRVMIKLYLELIFFL